MIFPRTHIAASLTAAVLLGSCALAAAAELRLRTQSASPGPVVRLSDVAEIVTHDAAERERLAAVEVMPAPAPGETRYLRARELQDLLLLRGINVAGLQFSGASQVCVGTPQKQAPAEPRPLSAALVREAHRRVHDAFVRTLSATTTSVGVTDPRKAGRGGAARTASDDFWTIEFELTDNQAKLVMQSQVEPTIRGPVTPTGDVQQVEVQLGVGAAGAKFVLEARVARPESVVVAARPVGRGMVLQAADLELAPAAPGAADDSYRTLDDLVGKETTRSLVPGKPLEKGDVRSPLLVHRGEIVTVFARGPGLQVRVTARAKEDGGQGDLVAVESVSNRDAYFARICGPRELEVFPCSLQTASASAQ